MCSGCKSVGVCCLALGLLKKLRCQMLVPQPPPPPPQVTLVCDLESPSQMGQPYFSNEEPFLQRSQGHTEHSQCRSTS